MWKNCAYMYQQQNCNYHVFTSTSRNLTWCLRCEKIYCANTFKDFPNYLEYFIKKLKNAWKVRTSLGKFMGIAYKELNTKIDLLGQPLSP